MGDLLRDGVAWMHERRHATMATLVEYSRDSVTIDILATVGQAAFEVDGAYDGRIAIQTRDYLIRVQDLDFGGGPVEPRPGDQITERINDQAQIYEVLRDDGIPAWQFSDTDRTVYRVHCKIVSE